MENHLGDTVRITNHLGNMYQKTIECSYFSNKDNILIYFYND